MMKEGKLVWSKNTQTGAWYTQSHTDGGGPELIYVATKLEPGCWEVSVIDRETTLRIGGVDFSAPVSRILGLRGTFVQGKRLADEHHHAYLREYGTAYDKRHILRYPVMS